MSMSGSMHTIVVMFEDDTDTACRIGQISTSPASKNGSLSSPLVSPPSRTTTGPPEPGGYIVSGINPVALLEISFRRTVWSAGWLLEELFREFGVVGPV
jgi:hypothetical protein